MTMKGGQTPIHIMRWAPADYVNDPFVMLMLRRNAYKVLVFYHLFLFRSHMEGGYLPSDRRVLAAMLAMSSRDATNALTICLREGKLVEANGRLYHKRVVAEVAKELSYRENQTELGKSGGRPKKGTLSDTESPPSPLPTPTPAPAPAPTGKPFPADRYGLPGESEALRIEIKALLSEESVSSGRPEDELLVEASDTGKGAIVSVDGCFSVPWLKVTRDKLTAMKLRRQGKARPQPSRPSAAAQARQDSAEALIRGGLRGDNQQGVGDGNGGAGGVLLECGPDARDGDSPRKLLPRGSGVPDR